MTNELFLKAPSLGFVCFDKLSGILSSWKMPRIKQLFVFVCFVLVQTVLSANILMSAEYGAGSHYIALGNMGEELVRRGHNVSFLLGAAFEFRRDQEPWSNIFNFEVLQHAHPHAEIIAGFTDFATLLHKTSYEQIWGYEKFIEGNYVDDCGSFFADGDLVRRLKDAKYDVIVFDTIWFCGALIAQELGIPSVGVVAGDGVQQAFPYAGIPINPAYMPIMTTGFSNRMSFKERLINTYYVWMIHYGRGTPFIPARQFGRIKGVQIYVFFK